MLAASTTKRRPRAPTTSAHFAANTPPPADASLRRRAFELYGAKAELNFPAEHGVAAGGAGAAAAAPPEDDSDPDDSPASAERIQRWIDKGLLYLAPLPADDGSFVYVDDGACAFVGCSARWREALRAALLAPPARRAAL